MKFIMKNLQIEKKLWDIPQPCNMETDLPTPCYMKKSGDFQIFVKNSWRFGKNL